LRDELQESFHVVPVGVSVETTPAHVAAALREHAPECIVLFDNKTAALYARYQRASERKRFPPAVVLLASFVDMYQDIENAVGIAYEVPIVISGSKLRTYISRPVNRIGVVHRRAFESSIRHQSQLARIEKLTVVSRSLPNDATPRELARALSSLLSEEEVDVLWVPNDNALLSPEHIAQGWLPLLAKDPIPTIVGIPGLVTREVPFGTFAVIPDLSALGLQAANLVYGLAAHGFRLDEAQRVEQPLSVETFLDLDRARAHFGFREEMRSEIGTLGQ
jgi:hypothetical protein